MSADMDSASARCWSQPQEAATSSNSSEMMKQPTDIISAGAA